MLYTEFNMEDALEVRYEEGEAAGMKKGEEQKADTPYSPDRSPPNTNFVSTGITLRWCFT